MINFHYSNNVSSTLYSQVGILTWQPMHVLNLPRKMPCTEGVWSVTTFDWAMRASNCEPGQVMNDFHLLM